MMTPATSTAAHVLDFALLQQSVVRPSGRNRRALWWLLILLALLLASVVTLLLYLNNFEADEAAHRRVADARWLEQSVQFHFRRLQDDLLVLARQATNPQTRSAAPQLPKGGLLLQEPGVVLEHGWLAAAAQQYNANGLPRWRLDALTHPANAQAQQVMQATTKGLRRAAFAGVMRHADGTPTDVVWLGVPLFDGGQFVGDYVAAVSLQRALKALVPPWFSHDHQLRLIADEASFKGAGYQVALNLPGADLFVQVERTRAAPTTVPRIFFLLALLFLCGMLMALFALRHDFIKRRQVQALLQAQVALRTAMENSLTTGLRAWDLQGRILYVNDAFTRMVGFSAAELVGKSMPFPYWPTDQHDFLVQVHAGIIARGTSGNGLELQFAHRDGHLIDVLIHESALNTASGEQIGWMSSVLDISERKRAQRMAALQQERLEASGRLIAVGEVASTLAHELNQPLGALSSFANGLLNRLSSANISLAELLPVVQRMAALAERAGNIIRRVGDFARRRDIVRQRLDLAALLQRVLVSCADTPGVGLHWTKLEAPLWVQADGLLLEHLIANLVANAQDWAPLGSAAPQVRVDLRPDLAAGMAVLSVADSGPGVGAEAAASIFNAFVSHKPGGMGMGLAICRSIVEAHHGRLEVGLDAALGGACFTVYLPLADFAAPLASQGVIS